MNRCIEVETPFVQYISLAATFTATTNVCRMSWFVFIRDEQIISEIINGGMELKASEYIFFFVMCFTSIKRISVNNARGGTGANPTPMDWRIEKNVTEFEKSNTVPANKNLITIKKIYLIPFFFVRSLFSTFNHHIQFAVCSVFLSL